jgi:Mg/Co/Ni transporter MgtE
VLRRLLDLPGGTLYVVDEQQRLVGAITTEAASASIDSAIPLEAAGAADFAVHVQTLDSSMTPDQFDAALRQTGLRQMPIVDPANGHLIGIIESSLPYKQAGLAPLRTSTGE